MGASVWVGAAAWVGTMVWEGASVRVGASVRLGAPVWEGGSVLVGATMWGVERRSQGCHDGSSNQSSREVTGWASAVRVWNLNTP